MFSLLLWWMLTVDNCSDTEPMTPTSTTWSNQNIIDWPVRLCTLHEQKEVLWRTPTTWLHAWPGMVRRPITSTKGEDHMLRQLDCGHRNKLQKTLRGCRRKSLDYIFDDILMYLTYHYARTRKSLSCHVYNLQRRLTLRASYLMQLSLLAA